MSIPQTIRHGKVAAKAFLLVGLVGFGSSVLSGQTPPKKPAPAPTPAAKPAAPAASAAKPAASGGGASKTGAQTANKTAGPVANKPAGPVANKPAGPIANKPSGPVANKPIAEPHVRPETGPGGPRPGSVVADRRGPVANAHGYLAHPPPIGARDRISPSGNVMRVRENGRPADFHDAHRGMDIHHNLGGGRSVMRERPDHSRVYYERGRPGYIGHPYRYGGRDFERRSYYYNGRAYDRFYNRYQYGGVYLNVYSPTRYYAPGFYGWAYNPWAVPVAYAWGFGAAPWYGYYPGYFTPYPVYSAPSLWLTDYLIAQSLQAAYAAHVAAAQEQAAEAVAAGGAPPPPLTPEIKQMISEEVQRQIALESSEAQANAQQQVADAAGSSVQRAIQDVNAGKPRVFVAGKEMDVMIDPDGQECAITDGDVLQLKVPPAATATSATLTVVSSKGGLECKNNVSVAVSLEDLQEMQNHMRETVDRGMEELQSKQGKNGIPAAPASALAPPVTALVAQNAPPPDPTVQQELATQAKEADAAEKEVQAETSNGTPVPRAPGMLEATAQTAPGASATIAAPSQTVNVGIGQSADDVTAAMGQPKLKLDKGAKGITYVYPNFKVTIKGGKVVDIQ